MSEPRQPVIVGGARTPVGRLLGSLASKSAIELGGIAIAGALERAAIGPDQVQYVIMGHVLQAGAGQITARQAAVAAGIGMDVPALTVNKVCLSGLDAIALASQLIRLGEYDVIVAGGMESMTRAPHLLPNSRDRLQVRPGAARGLDGPRRPDRRVRPPVHGRVHRTGGAQARPQPRRAGRVRRRLPPARRGRGQERPVRRGDRPGSGPSQGRAGQRDRGRGHPPRHHGGGAGQAQARVRRRTARSRPAPRRRSPTAPPPWW